MAGPKKEKPYACLRLIARLGLFFAPLITVDKRKGQKPGARLGGLQAGTGKKRGVFALFRPKKGTKNRVSLGGNAPVFFLRARFAVFLGGLAHRAPTPVCSRAVPLVAAAPPRPVALRLWQPSGGAPRAPPRGSFFSRKTGGEKRA